MTREDAIKFLPLIKAYSEGKTIQIDMRPDWNDPEWSDMPGKDIAFNGVPSSYRIKPEPEYEPYDITDAVILIDRVGWYDGKRYRIKSVGKTHVWTDTMFNVPVSYSYEFLLAHFVNCEGKPFGKIKKS